MHFHKDVNASLIKSLAFARVFTNALTGCEMGAAVGGADFDPSNKSEAEVQRFCQAYMTELSKCVASIHSHIPSQRRKVVFEAWSSIHTSPARINTNRYIGPDQDLPGVGTGVGARGAWDAANRSIGKAILSVTYPFMMDDREPLIVPGFSLPHSTPPHPTIEIGYLAGQYRRISVHHAQKGKGRRAPLLTHIHTGRGAACGIGRGTACGMHG